MFLFGFKGLHKLALCIEFYFEQLLTGWSRFVGLGERQPWPLRRWIDSNCKEKREQTLVAYSMKWLGGKVKETIMKLAPVHPHTNTHTHILSHTPLTHCGLFFVAVTVVVVAIVFASGESDMQKQSNSFRLRFASKWQAGRQADR